VTISLVSEARGGPFVFWDDLSAACEVASELGFDAIEIFAPSADGLNTEQLQRLLNRHALEVAAFGTGAGWVKHQLTLTDSDRARRQQAITFVRSIIDLAGGFGAPAIIGSMQGRFTAAHPKDEAMSLLADALQELGQHAATFGVPLIYEPLNRYETNLCNRLGDGVDLLESLATDNVLLLADLFHMNIEELDVGQAIRDAGHLVGHVHFADSNRHAVGCGHLSIASVMHALRDIGYGGYLSAEVLARPDSRTAAERTIQAFQYWTPLSR
jgi:sugar phosphate isomerase/epimerase